MRIQLSRKGDKILRTIGIALLGLLLLALCGWQPAGMALFTLVFFTILFGTHGWWAILLGLFFLALRAKFRREQREEDERWAAADQWRAHTEEQRRQHEFETARWQAEREDQDREVCKLLNLPY